MKKIISVTTILCVCAAGVQAAFIVEPFGLSSGNFSGTPRSSAVNSTAPGLTVGSHAWGSTTVGFDVYEYSYTPGSDEDNWTVPLDARYFGNGQYSTNLPGGQTGYYNVYITWPGSTNVSSLCDLTITHDGTDIVWTDINMNDSGTVAMAQMEQWGPFPAGTVFVGGNNKWLMIAREVLLTEGNTYTVTQAAQNDTYVSMRSSGVMWEFVRVPEPMSLVLLGAGGLLIRRRP